MTISSTISAEKQLQFIAYIQRIFIESDFSATYKFALLHALADLCVERPAHYGESLQLSLDDIAEKFIELYWQHTVPYTATDAEPALLQQNSGKQSKLVTDLCLFRSEGLHSTNQLRSHPQWRILLRQSKQLLKVGPLWRLQKLNGKEETFLYEHTHSSSHILLHAGIADCFRRFYDLVVGLTRTHWVQKIRTYPSNNNLIGDKGNLEDFLFGSERRSLHKVGVVLRELQKGQCFYCRKEMREEGQVDHFIPWARYPVDLAHNFVLAHSSCNNSKRAHIAAFRHREHWYEQNIEQFGATLEQELSHRFIADITRSQAVTHWAYQQAEQSKSMLWLGVGEFEPFHAEIPRTRSLEELF